MVLLLARVILPELRLPFLYFRPAAEANGWLRQAARCWCADSQVTWDTQRPTLTTVLRTGMGTLVECQFCTLTRSSAIESTGIGNSISLAGLPLFSSPPKRLRVKEGGKEKKELIRVKWSRQRSPTKSVEKKSNITRLRNTQK